MEKRGKVRLIRNLSTREFSMLEADAKFIIVGHLQIMLMDLIDKGTSSTLAVLKTADAFGVSRDTAAVAYRQSKELRALAIRVYSSRYIGIKNSDRKKLTVS